MADDWREKIIKERLGGKKDWTDEERTELCRRLDQDLDQEINKMAGSGKKMEGGWTEDNWKEQMAEHPIFAPYLQDGDKTLVDNALAEGLAQIKYDPDHSSPTEVAQNYKEEGNLQYKYKKYKLAIANFTEGLKQKCPDQELNAQLYNNRAAAHFQLENNRSAIQDCAKAVDLKPNYTKAVTRAVDCAVRMRKWDEVTEWCDRGLKLEPDNEKYKKERLNAMKEKKLQERNERRKKQEEKKKESEEQMLLKIIASRGVKLGTLRMKQSSSITLADLEPCHPAAQGSRVYIDPEGALVWPVMLLYPEHHESDFIKEFIETNCLLDHLEVMFGPDAPDAPWDAAGKYHPRDMAVFFEDKEHEKLYEVDIKQSLQQVLMHPRYRVMGGTPGFIVLIKGSKFMMEFMAKYT